MPRFTAALLTCVVVSPTMFVSSVSAQVIYEPVRYQYGGQTPYYYGGSNPDVFQFADREYAETRNGFAAARGNVMTHREISSLFPHVYVDHLPRTNAARRGYTADDARNAANRNTPRYFRKHDLLTHALRQEDGTWRVPAQIASPEISSSSFRGSIVIKPHLRATPGYGPVFVFPKGLLDKKIVQPKSIPISVTRAW